MTCTVLGPSARQYRITLTAIALVLATLTLQAQEAETAAGKPSAEKEMQERITRAKNKLGWPDPEIGKGALDETEAAKYAEMKHLFKRPHFNKPTPQFAGQWEKLASYPIPEWMLDGKFGVYKRRSDRNGQLCDLQRNRIFRFGNRPDCKYNLSCGGL